MRRFATPVIIIVILIFVGIGGFWLGKAGIFYLSRENLRLTKLNQELKHRIGGEEVVLFFVKSNSTKFLLKPVLYKVKGKEDKHLQALNALFAGPPVGSNLSPVFPKETKVLNLEIKEGVATVNLNKDATRLNVGSSGELLAVAAIVNTLTKFPDVFQVKILIDGKEVESLAGHVDLTEPLLYSDQVVDPELF